MRHNQQYFYKYVSAETALLILKNKKLKYSSPFTFNDPFDVQTEINFDFEIEDLILLLGAKIDKEIETFIAMFKDKHKELNEWWNAEARDSRVFCVAEDNDNLLMWAHYAKDHHGAVIQFECLTALDTTLCAALKINYVNKPPVIATLDEYIKSYTGKHKLNHDALYFKMFTSKSDHWEYEKEWRVFIPPNPAFAKMTNENDPRSILMDVYPQEIHSIYLGCKMEDNIQKDIENNLDGDFSHVHIYKSIKDEKEYKLNFEKIR